MARQPARSRTGPARARTRGIDSPRSKERKPGVPRSWSYLVEVQVQGHSKVLAQPLEPPARRPVRYDLQLLAEHVELGSQSAELNTQLTHRELELVRELLVCR